MAGYGEFAGVYDLLTENVPYDEIAEYYNSIITSLGGGRRLLDMGCGTGSLSVRLAEMGYEVTGSDASADMLSIAAQKSDKVRWIC
ncbi:MAG: methyltransferase domain-containing protein, partial [Oscillospiraceae bacterium]|nr:methyltransferase domain-containing protein [Oscillospiraceae bacterium]